MARELPGPTMRLHSIQMGTPLRRDRHCGTRNFGEPLSSCEVTMRKRIELVPGGKKLKTHDFGQSRHRKEAQFRRRTTWTKPAFIHIHLDHPTRRGNRYRISHPRPEMLLKRTTTAAAFYFATTSTSMR